MKIINDIRLYSHRPHTYIAYIRMSSVKTVFIQHENNKCYPLKHIYTKTNVYMEIKLIIVKSEWFNLRLLVTEG